MKQYKELLQDIMANGTDKGDRTGTGTRSVFGRQMRFDLAQGFPLLTTKKLHFKSIAVELLWLISGSTNIRFMKDHGVTIWDEWADEKGELGPVYGKQWRAWESPDESNTVDSSCLEYSRHRDSSNETFYGVKLTDQLKQIIERIMTNPDCRRLIVTAWNPADISKMKLPPCHAFFQFYTRELTLLERRQCMEKQGRNTRVFIDSLTADELDMAVPRRALSCHMYQRSADTFLGVPYNIASYALLTHMVAHLTEMAAGELVHSFGDVHIYKNHFDQVHEQLSRQPRPLPQISFARKVESIDDFKYEDFVLTGYDPHPAIKALVSV